MFEIRYGFNLRDQCLRYQNHLRSWAAILWINGDQQNRFHGSKRNSFFDSTIIIPDNKEVHAEASLNTSLAALILIQRLLLSARASASMLPAKSIRLSISTHFRRALFLDRTRKREGAKCVSSSAQLWLVPPTRSFSHCLTSYFRSTTSRTANHISLIH